MKDWKVLMTNCRQARVFCVRVVYKLWEMFLGCKVG